MNYLRLTTTTALWLIFSFCVVSNARPEQNLPTQTDEVRAAVFSCQVLHGDTVGSVPTSVEPKGDYGNLDFLLGGGWQDAAGIHFKSSRLHRPSPYVLTMVLRQVRQHGVRIHVVHYGYKDSPHGHDILTIAALRRITPTYVIAYGKCFSEPATKDPNGTQGENDFRYDVHYRHHHWAVTRATPTWGAG